MLRSKSLQARFRTAVLTISAVLVMVVTVVVHLSAKSYYLAAGTESARASVAAVAKTLAVGVYARDDVLLKELVDGLSRHPAIARVAVTDAKKALLASAEASLAPASSEPGLDPNAPPSFGTRLVSPFLPIESVGRLDVWLDTPHLATEATHQAALVAGALVVLLTAVLIVINEVASRLLSRPLHRLAAELALIVPGTERRLTLEPEHEGDEVGVVTMAANRLLDLQQAALEREHEMLEEITALEARYRGIFDSTSAGIFILNAQGVLQQSNPALSRLLGTEIEPASASAPDAALDSASDVSPSSSTDFSTGRSTELSPDAQPTASADFASSAFVRPAQLTHLIDRARESSQPEAADLELLRRDGTTLWAHCMVSLSTDAVTGEECVEGVLYNVTQRKVQERTAQHSAEHDALTGLKSRAYIESALDQQVKSSWNDERAVTLLFIDLDGFKAVNDRWGHAAGDAVLIEAAQRLRSLFKRGCDVVGRLGGDELVVMIVGVEAIDDSVALLAAQLIDGFKAPFRLPNGQSARVGASVGVASYPRHATSARTLIRAADAAMYAVKQAGKGGYVVADTGYGLLDDRPSAWHDLTSERRRRA